MAKFHLTAPDGAEYEVDGDNAEGAVAAVQKLRAPQARSTTLNIEGRKVDVDDSFLKLSPDQQNATVDEIHKSLQKPVTDPSILAKLNAPEPKPIHIGAPDGSIVEFPAGTSDDTIKSAMAKAYPAPAAQATPEPKGILRTVREAIHAPTRALENGAFLGLGDRARAVIDSVVSFGSHPTLSSQITGDDGSYAANLRKEQGDTEQFAKDHPIASPVLEAAGGAIAPLAVVKAAAAPATLGMKTLAGAGAGAGIGTVQGAFSSKDYTDLPQVAKDAAIGGGIGLGTGILIPGSAKIIGAGYEKLANLATGKVEGMSRGAGAHLVKAVEADGPVAVQARMAELGPDAMLADAGPALLGKAQGASLNSDEGRSVLQTALTKRNEGTNARVQSDVNGALGPAEDPQLVTDAIKAHRSAVDSVNYPAALDNAPSVKIAPIMSELIDRIEQTPSGSMEHKALSNLQDMLTKTERRPLSDASGFPQYDKLGNERWQDVPVSHDDANILHKVKGELDNVIEYDAPGLGVPAGALTRQQGSLKQMRGAINDALEKQVPGYANANAVSAAMAKRGEAVNLGTQYLGSGKTTASPERFAAAFDPLDQGTKIAFAKGSRGEIERVLGTKANNLQALKNELQGEGGWNGAKIATVHGTDAADELASSVERNLKFRDTHTKVVEGSQTDLRNAARKEMKPDPSTETPLFNPNSTLAGMGVTIAKKGVSTVISALLHSDPTRHYGEVARALTEQGAARNARLSSIIDALNSRQGNAAGGETAGKVGSVVAALLSSAELERRHAVPVRGRQP
jgi:hypothetical protein